MQTQIHYQICIHRWTWSWKLQQQIQNRIYGIFAIHTNSPNISTKYWIWCVYAFIFFLHAEEKLPCLIYFNMNINKFFFYLDRMKTFFLCWSYAFDWKHRLIHTVALFMPGNERILNVMNHDNISVFLISNRKKGWKIKKISYSIEQFEIFKNAC